MSCKHYVYKSGDTYRIGKNPSGTIFYVYTTCTPTPTITPSVSSCPDPSMKILLDNGSYIAAGDLRKGMKVRTYHEKTLEYGSYEVTYVGIAISEKIKILFKDKSKEPFICSLSHKFAFNNDWIEAQNLKNKDVISGHEIASIEKYRVGPVVVITVENAHTYICENLLSHNKLEVTPTPTSSVTPTITPTITPSPSPYTCNNGCYYVCNNNSYILITNYCPENCSSCPESFTAPGGTCTNGASVYGPCAS